MRSKIKKKQRTRKNILYISLFLMFTLGVGFAYANKPKNIKYGSINIECVNPTLSTVEAVSSKITSTKPGIKISIKNNTNDSEMIYKMLEGKVDIIIPSRELNEEEEALAKQYKITYKKLPFAISKDNTDLVYYIYINDINYNKKPENKVFTKNYYGEDRNLIVTKDVNPLTEKEYNNIIDYIKLLDEY